MKFQKLKKWKYRLAEAYVIPCNLPFEIRTDYFILTEGKLFFNKGYAWDGASGPCPDVRTVMVASLVHDALYQSMRLQLISTTLKEFADQELKRLCIEAGMPRFWAQVVYFGVHFFAHKGVRPLKEPVIYSV